MGIYNEWKKDTRGKRSFSVHGETKSPVSRKDQRSFLGSRKPKVSVIERKLKDIEFEKIPAVVKRCPNCHSLSLEFEPKTGRIYCTKCGFEEHFQMIK